ncbi:MAG: hypothetical protein B7733_02435, partial [Myxococcales bacterium FL481]
MEQSPAPRRRSTEEFVLAMLRISLLVCVSGFVYEQLVDVPNLLGPNAVEAQAVWVRYHHRSDPGWFFAPPMLVALSSLVWLWFRCPQRIRS